VHELLSAKTPIKTLTALARAEAECTRCPLYRNATQAVPGEGSAQARLMFVGEQPGNDEDLAGKPFVGPAGRVLDKAIHEAGLERTKIFITNAVKHFKFEPRGKRRLHKRPSVHEIERCRLWNEFERKLVEPELIVALGATAARSLVGRPVTIAKQRGRVLTIDSGERVVVTVHPSYLLRIEDEADKAREYRQFVADLRACSNFLARAA